MSHRRRRPRVGSTSGVEPRGTTDEPGDERGDDASGCKTGDGQADSSKKAQSDRSEHRASGDSTGNRRGRRFRGRRARRQARALRRRAEVHHRGSGCGCDWWPVDNPPENQQRGLRGNEQDNLCRTGRNATEGHARRAPVPASLAEKTLRYAYNALRVKHCQIIMDFSILPLDPNLLHQILA